MVDLELNKLITELKGYLGITRKKSISDVVHAFPKMADNFTDMEVLADFGEDAAVLALPSQNNYNDVFLLAADGIMSTLLNADPYWAGYCSVLVNLHDIAAMGGVPIALVDVLSIKDKNILSELTSGMNDACTKFGVPIVGGHLHPDSEFNAIDVAIFGTATRSGVIYSHSAKIGDCIIIALDLDGHVHPKSKYSWDTTQHKSPELVRQQLGIMSELGSAGLVRAGKDISNPGILGTLGMLLESSKTGALIDMINIPYPGENVVEFTHWLMMYQGCGFVVTTDLDNSKTVLDKFGSAGLTAKIAGEIIEEKQLIVKYHDEKQILFNFNQENITGI